MSQERESEGGCNGESRVSVPWGKVGAVIVDKLLMLHGGAGRAKTRR